MRYFGLFGCVAVIISNNPANAQQSTAGNSGVSENGPIPEIIVTAQRRAESLQKAAASIEVRSGKDLLIEGKVTLRQQLEDIPGVSDTTQVNILGPTAGTYIVIRGLTTDQSLGPGINPSATAVYVDGVYEGFGGSYDIDRVEALLGPQGTLYGRSATAGVIAVNTVQPKLGAWTGNLSGEYGTANLARVQGALNVPLGDTLAVRVSGSDLSQDGYDAKAGIGHRHITDGRIKLLFKPAPDFDATLTYTHEQVAANSGGVEFDSEPTGLVTSSFPVSPSRSLGNQVSGVINWNLGGAVLSYLGSYQDYHNTAVNLIAAGPPGADPIQSNANIPIYRSLTQEIHLASEAGSKVTWIGGLIYYRNRLSSSNDTFSTASSAPLFFYTLNKTTEDLGAFAQATYPFSGNTRLTAGARYDHTRVQTSETYTVNDGGSSVPPFSPAYGLPEDLESATLSGSDGRRVFDNGTFKLRLEHDLTPLNLLYGLVATGFLPGDVRVTTVSGAPYATPYGQQTLTSFEIGTKNQFFGRRLTLNAAAYYNKYTGYEVSANVNAGSGTAQPNNVTMQSPARMKGFEAEAIYLPTRHDRFSLNAGYTDAKFVDKPNTALNPFAANFLLDTIPNVAPWRVSPTYQHSFDFSDKLNVSARINGVYTSAFYIIPYNSLTIETQSFTRQPGHMVGNIDLTVNYDKFYLTGYVRNFTNHRYITYNIGYGNMLVNDVTVGLTDPRVFGVIAGVRF